MLHNVHWVSFPLAVRPARGRAVKSSPFHGFDLVAGVTGMKLHMISSTVGLMRRLGLSAPIRSLLEKYMFEQHKGADASLLVRTNFTDDAAWAKLCALVQAPSQEDYRAELICMSDRQLENVAPKTIARQVYQDLGHSVVFVADDRAMNDPDHPILCVSADDAVVASFRVVPEEIWAPENNLRIANLDFEDFVNATDAGGVFRGS